jgi:hypothetical protein
MVDNASALLSTAVSYGILIFTGYTALDNYFSDINLYGCLLAPIGYLFGRNIPRKERLISTARTIWEEFKQGNRVILLALFRKG